MDDFDKMTIVFVAIMLVIVGLVGWPFHTAKGFVEGEVVRVAHPVFQNETYTMVHFADGKKKTFNYYADVPLGNVTIVYNNYGEIVEVRYEDYDVVGRISPCYPIVETGGR